MRVAGGVLGILGGIFGLVLAFFIVVVGAVGKAASNEISRAAAEPTVSSSLTADQKSQVEQSVKAASDFGNLAGGLGMVLFALCILGFVGGIMAFFKPSIGAILMAAAAVGGFFIVSVFWGFSGLLLGLGAILAFVGTFSKPAVQAQPAVVPGYYPAPTRYPQQGYYPQQQAYPPQSQYPQQQAYPQQPQGFPQPNQYARPDAPPQAYYPQPTNQGYPPQGGQQQYYPRPTTAPQGQQVVPPQDNTQLN